MNSPSVGTMVAGSFVIWATTTGNPLISHGTTKNDKNTTNTINYQEAGVLPMTITSLLAGVAQTAHVHSTTIQYRVDVEIDKWTEFDALFGAWEDLDIADNFVEELRQSSSWLIANDSIYDE